MGTAWDILKTGHVLRNFLQRIVWRELGHVQWLELTKNFREVGEAKRIPSKSIGEGKARKLTREVDGPETLSYILLSAKPNRLIVVWACLLEAAIPFRVFQHL